MRADWRTSDDGEGSDAGSGVGTGVRDVTEGSLRSWDAVGWSEALAARAGRGGRLGRRRCLVVERAVATASDDLVPPAVKVEQYLDVVLNADRLLRG